MKEYRNLQGEVHLIPSPTQWTSQVICTPPAKSASDSRKDNGL